MEELFNSTYNKVKMDEDYRAELRDRLYELREYEQSGMIAGRRLRNGRIRNIERGYTGIFFGKLAVMAAFTLAVLMCIPVTRGGIMNAAEYVKMLLHAGNGNEVAVEHSRDAEKEWVSTTVTTGDEYLAVEGDRMYFVLADIKEDITDKCADDKWFRYESILDDGGTSVILIGGTPEHCGWAELLFDVNGNYITNHMSCPPDSQWLDPAMAAEGVPTGNPEYDQEFLKD